VLGAQVAVPVNNPAFTNTLFKHLALTRKKAALHTIDPPDKPCWHVKAGIEQYPAIV
jgi:hypothetical protein